MDPTGFEPVCLTLRTRRRTRTSDQRYVTPPLYQLSYACMCWVPTSSETTGYQPSGGPSPLPDQDALLAGYLALQAWVGGWFTAANGAC